MVRYIMHIRLTHLKNGEPEADHTRIPCIEVTKDKKATLCSPISQHGRTWKRIVDTPSIVVGTARHLDFVQR